MMTTATTETDALGLSIAAVQQRTLSLRIFVDPATIAAIISIGESIASLFGGGDDIGKVIDLIKQLDQSVANLSQQMDSIATQLSNLQVYIDQQFVKQKDADVLGISDAVKAYLDVWKSDYARCQREVPDYLRTLQYAVGANIRYSFAGYDTVAYGMSIERTLLDLLKEVGSVKRSRYSQYFAYFQTGLDPSVAGTVGSRLLAAQTDRDKFVQTNTYRSESRVIRHVNAPRPPDWGIQGPSDINYVDGDLVFVFDGSPGAGYTAQVQVINEQLISVSTAIGGGERHTPSPGGKLDYPSPLQEQWEAEANAVAAKLTSDTKAALAELTGRINMLKAALGSVTNYSAAATNLMNAI
jgi:hypothetical protein